MGHLSENALVEHAGWHAGATFPSVVAVDAALLLRAIEIYEVDRLDFAEAYLVACAETKGAGKVASFDGSIDRVTTVQRSQPGAVN